MVAFRGDCRDLLVGGGAFVWFWGRRRRKSSFGCREKARQQGGGESCVREILEGESFPSAEGGELPLPLKRFSWEAVDYRERGRELCV